MKKEIRERAMDMIDSEDDEMVSLGMLLFVQHATVQEMIGTFPHGIWKANPNSSDVPYRLHHTPNINNVYIKGDYTLFIAHSCVVCRTVGMASVWRKWDTMNKIYLDE